MWTSVSPCGGADATRRDGESGWTPLHRAFHFGALRAAAALLARGASLAAPLDAAGRAPVDILSGKLRHVLPRHRDMVGGKGGNARFGGGGGGGGGSGGGGSGGDGAGCDLYAWGSGVNFQLGTGAVGIEHVPRRVDAPAEGTTHLRGVVACSAAKFHSVAATADGAVYAWGHGRGGRLGVADPNVHSGAEAVLSPRRLPLFGDRGVMVIAVSAAAAYTRSHFRST